MTNLSFFTSWKTSLKVCILLISLSLECTNLYFLFSDQPDLKEWIFNHFEQGLAYQMMKYAKIGFPYLVKPGEFIAHYVIPIVHNLHVIFSAYFELFKDLVFFLVLNHFTEEILVRIFVYLSKKYI